MRPLQPLVEIFRQLGGAGRALPSRHKTHPASMFGGPRLVRRPLGIIHVTDVYVVFGFRRCKSWLSPAPGYLGTRDEKSGLTKLWGGRGTLWVRPRAKLAIRRAQTSRQAHQQEDRHHFPHSRFNTSADTLRPQISRMTFLPCQRGASFRNAATATPAAPSITQCSVSNISRMARRISSSLTSTPRSITRRQTSKVTEPASSPPAVLSDSVGRSATSTMLPACKHWCITGEFSGQQPTISVSGETAFRYSPMPPISPPPPTATKTASGCGNCR